MERQKHEIIVTAAGFWDARLRAPSCTDEDRQQFAAWRDADVAHRQAFERLQVIVSTLRQHGSRADLRAIRDAALALAERRRKRVTWAVAASIAVLACTALLWALAPQLTGLSDLAAFNWERTGDFSTGIGQRSTVTLQDGSTVELNSKTRIRVAFVGKRRFVELLEGQAMFQVAKDTQRPFVVRASNREIVAVGTQFDVRLDSAGVRVTLLEGKVAVTSQGSSALALALTSATSSKSATQQPGAATTAGERTQAIYLSPGQQLTIARHAQEIVAPSGSAPEQMIVRNIDVAKATSWRAGQVFFEDLALVEAIAEMNKHSLVQISIEDASLDGLRVNGMFRSGEQQAFARALEEYFPLVVERRSETQLVLKRRN
jgi:transmembrane sensor